MHYFFSFPLVSDPNILEISALEASIQNECTLEKLNRIMDLFKIVIENFESEGNPQSKDYQARMKTLLSLPKVRNTLTASNPLVSKRASREMGRELSTERIVNKEIFRHKSETKYAIEIVQNDLKAQSDSLNQRILKRRKSNRDFENFEKEVEKIVEKYVIEKEKIIEAGNGSKLNLQVLENNKKLEISKMRKKHLNM